LKVHYYKDSVGNFGDDLNPWLWPQLFPKPIEQCFDNDTLFVGIGSLLNHKIPAEPPKKIIFGSGFSYGSLPKTNDLWRFVCVRGPLTAKALGLSEDKAITDSALLLLKVANPSREQRHKASFMPHHQTAKYDSWREICDDLNICYIDPAAPVKETIDTISNSSVLITEAMHGAIVADAYRIPWVPVRTRPRIVEFKWQDWSLSMGIEHEFEWLSPAWSRNIDLKWKRMVRPVTNSVAKARLQWLIRYGRRRLSNERNFRAVCSRLTDAFDQLITEI
jgi:succinoglycan biosynthesis protein ExoV